MDCFDSFTGLRTIELGCGKGKVSLLFNIKGAETTIVDYNQKQLEQAKYIIEAFEMRSILVKENILKLSNVYENTYDVSMSFGTVEHFFGIDRQDVFEIHYRVLKKGGITVIWVPNKYGMLFHFGVYARRLFNKNISPVDETPFDRKELLKRSRSAGFTNIKIIGGELLQNDFSQFIINYQRMLKLWPYRKKFISALDAKKELLKSMILNKKKIKPWNNYFSYPLILVAQKIS